jgi:hypothetical protein
LGGREAPSRGGGPYIVNRTPEATRATSRIERLGVQANSRLIRKIGGSEAKSWMSPVRRDIGQRTHNEPPRMRSRMRQ